MKESLVSVIVPTYKRPNTLDRTIKSVLNQTYSNVEVIVVDDNNPDSEGRQLTEAKMEEFEGNERVHYIKHEKNKGGSAARNTGARNAKGEFISFLDDDDEYLPKCIESRLARLNELPQDYALCYSTYITRVNGSETISTECREGDLFLDALMQNIMIAAGSNLTIRKDAFDSINGFDETFVRNQDHELLVRLLKKYKIAHSPEPGLIVNVAFSHHKFDYQEVSKHYVENFKLFIDDLTPNDRKTFYRNINKLRFIDFVRTKHDLKGAFGLVRNGEVSTIEAISYLFGGFTRIIKRKVRK